MKREQGSTSWDSHLEYCMSRDPGLVQLLGGVKEVETQRHQHLVKAEGGDAETEDGVAPSSDPSTAENGSSLQEAPIDSRAFAQKLYSTTTWRLASFIEIYRGKYRMLPPWAEDVFNPIIQALTEQEPARGAEIRSSKPNVRYASLHPHIGVFDYPLGISSLPSTKPEPSSPSSFGRLYIGLSYQHSPKRKYEELSRTSPAGSDNFLRVLDVNDKRHVLLRSVANVLGSPTELAKYALDPRVSISTNKAIPRTLHLGFLVQDLAYLLELDRHPRIIIPSLTHSIKSTYLKSPLEQPQGHSQMPDAEAAHIINVGIAALIASVSGKSKEPRAEGWQEFIDCRRKGHFSSSEPQNPAIRKSAVQFMVSYQDELALHLMRLILRCIASRAYRNSVPFEPDVETANGCQRFGERASIFRNNILLFLRPETHTTRSRHVRYAKILLEWTRSIFLQEWDGAAEFSWSSDFGCAVDFLWVLCKLVPLLPCISLIVSR